MVTLIPVALRKESVDRNKYVVQCRKTLGVVALRKESVDRNQAADISARREARSLSARRAWIEMVIRPAIDLFLDVALRKESVDRNFHAMQIVIIVMGRSPQGERG